MSSRSPSGKLTRREAIAGLAAFPLFHATAASGGYHRRGADRAVHLVNFTGDKRVAGGQRLQEAAAVHGIRIHARFDVRPSRVRHATSRKILTSDWRDGWISFAAQPLILHDAYIIEG